MITGIIGATQGGTSAVASVVRSLGIPMWGLDRTLDDAELFGPAEVPRMVIQARNERHSGWAWKYPMKYGPELDFSDRFIVVWRDPIARAVHRRDMNAPNMTVFTEWFEVVDTYKGIQKPRLDVSYEKLLVRTEETVQMIADFLEVPAKREAILAVDAVKGYERTKEVNIPML